MDALMKQQMEHPPEDAFDPEAAIAELFENEAAIAELLEDKAIIDAVAEALAEEVDVTVTVDDLVNKPDHYTRWVIEPITFIMRNGFEFWRGNIVKYASRAGYKLYPDMDAVESEITDLRKVIRYAQMRINQLEGEMEL